MAGKKKPRGQWLLLCAAVARMSELSPIYQKYPGYARRDLENAIRARRASIRGAPVTGRNFRPVKINWPLDSTHRLDLVHDTLSQRTRSLHDMTLYLSVEVEWTKKLNTYLRTIAADVMQPTGRGRR
jgi:hypothetical protein